MCRSMVDIQSPTAEIRRGIKKERKELQGKNIMSASAMQGGHKNESKYSEIGPVRRNPIQRIVRSVHMCVFIALCTIAVHNIAHVS